MGVYKVENQHVLTIESHDRLTVPSVDAQSSWQIPEEESSEVDGHMHLPQLRSF